MPLPFIIGGIAAAALFGTAAAYFWDDIFESSKDKEKMNGAKIAILGTRAVGKSTLFDFLQTNKIDINKKYEQTRTVRRIDASTIDIDGVEIDISVNYDVGGSSANHREWQDRIIESDYVIYLVDANKVLTKDNKHLIEIKEDLQAISEHMRNSRKKLFLIGSKADEHRLYKSDYNAFENLFLKSPIILESQLIIGGSDKCKIIVGSLSSNDEAKKLVKQFLNDNN